MNIYTMDFGVYGSVVVIAADIDEAYELMKNSHEMAQYEDKSRIEIFPITNGFVHVNRGDL